MAKQIEITNQDIINQFTKAYPYLPVSDYRPLSPDVFTKGRIGITVWLENGDIIQYYPTSIEIE